ncbi:MAG: TlpA family protein disulfide reductase [Bacteroidales bacterium]|nr:TlpA family protein disulfide reductase [Bacteroidales bacterium]MBN2749084.1 TlpA family protein disulfide reductase [Bacteroidales bacterium]
MKISVSFFCCIVFSLNVFAQGNLVGKKAPKIEIEKWIYPKIKTAEWEVKGVPEKIEGRIIVVDFWFTKCAPCVASIPELNFLAQKYPEILFLSISFEKEDLINEFLKKMVMYYPVGSDPDSKTINSFGVQLYPETFLIDEFGIVRWQGSPFDLDEEILNGVSERQGKTKTLRIPHQETKQLNSAYTFTIQKHNLEMGESSYFHYNPFDISILNRTLGDLLNVFYGMSKPRIINRKNIPLETAFDITLKADKSITTEANCVEMLRFLLPQQLGVNIKEVEMDTVARVVGVLNNRLLENNLSSENNLGVTIRYNNWEAKGARIVDLKNFLENQFNMLVEVEAETNSRYNFVLSNINLFEVEKKLENDYGIRLINKKVKTKFWVLE